MRGLEATHIDLQRIAEIVSSGSPTEFESAHIGICTQCRRYIEREKLLSKAIADFRRRHQDRESELHGPSGGEH
jgi:hypothetical protein